MKNYLLLLLSFQSKGELQQRHPNAFWMMDHLSALKCPCKPPWRERFLDCNCSGFPDSYFVQRADQSRHKQLLLDTGTGRTLAAHPSAGCCRTVPKFIPLNDLCLSENRTFTSNSTSGGHPQGWHLPLLKADLLFRVQCKGKMSTTLKKTVLDPL